jgi:alpha-1,3-rhamnosyl/mannosyltransferase
VTFHDSFYAVPVIASARIPLSKGGWQREYLRVAQRVAARRAAAVLTVSESAKAGIVRHFALPPEAVAVTLEAAAPCFRRVSDPDTVQRVCARYGLRPGFVMALGSPDPRKNVAAVIDAYAALPTALREQHALAIVWTHPRLASGIALYSQQRYVSQEICFLPSVPDDELAVLYSSAAVFVFPSLGEGFGLPPLEAMACGAPVIAANTSAVPEVVGSAAILIDPADGSALTTAMVRLLEDATRRDALSRAGRARAADFSWERCARQTRAVYQRVVSDRAERATAPQLDSALGTGG